MAITYPLAFPTHKNPVGVIFRQRKVVGLNVSPGSLIPQTYEWSGERWEADITFGPMSRANAEAWIAWATSLRGPVGSFTMGDPAGQTPRGTASGSVTATGSIRARTITLSGGSGTLLAGDWISVGSSRWLHKVLQNVTLGGSPSCEIWPSLRAALSGSTVTFTAAKGRFMLLETPEWSIGRDSVYTPPALKAVEDLRP